MTTEERRRRFRPAEAARVLVPVIALWVAGLAAIALLLSTDRVSREMLFLDSTELVELPWYTGMLSSVGVLLWSIGAVVALMTGYVAWLGGRERAAVMMAHGGALGAALCLDDLFELHAALIPNHTPLPKSAVLALLAAFALSWLVWHLAEISRTRWPMLVAALGAFGGSVVVDHFNGGGRGSALVLEDGAKLLGVLAWAAYFVSSARDIVASVVVDLRDGASGAGGKNGLHQARRGKG